MPFFFFKIKQRLQKVLYFVTIIRHKYFNTAYKLITKIKAQGLPLDLLTFYRLLIILYQNRSGYKSDMKKEQGNHAAQGIFLTYGEVLPEGMSKIFDLLQLTEKDSFIDLGSGAGKIVLQSFFCTKASSCYGVEIDDARYSLSCDVLEQVREMLDGLEKLKPKTSKIKFIKENIKDLEFDDYTVIFVNSVCFDHYLMETIVTKINASLKVRAFITTRSITGLEHLSKHEIIPIETSWHVPPNKTRCHIFYRD